MPQITPNPTGPQASDPNQVNPSATQEAGGQSQQSAAQAVLTRDDIRSIFRESMVELSREQQSQRDKLEARIAKQFQSVMDAAAAGGITLTQEQQQKAREKIASQVQQEEELPQSLGTQRQAQAQPTEPSRQQAPNQAEATNPLNDLANSIMDAEGIDIEETDPEARAIDWTDRKTVYASMRQAIEDKRRRTANANNPLTRGAPAGTNPIANITNTDDLWRIARGKG